MHLTNSSIRSALAGGLLLAGLTLQAPAALARDDCGAVVTLDTHDGTRTAYSLAGVSDAARVALVLLAGGSGFVDLDDEGCARKLRGNSLISSRALFHERGFATALVDAPSDHRGEDGLGGFRVAAQHAEDIGKVIADVRARTKLPVWLVGTSRGTISAANAVSASAANAASALPRPQMPDGLVLTSPVTSGHAGGRKAWVEQTVFSTSLGAIVVPLLVVAHADDTCIRTPPGLAGTVADKAGSARKQTVIVTGGAGPVGARSVEACQGRSPHGFDGRRAEVADGIARFIGGGQY